METSNDIIISMRKKTYQGDIQVDKEIEKKKVPDFQRTIRWDKLDNTAHLFPVIAGEQMTNVYRISVTLTEPVDPDLLQKALDIVLPKFDIFNVRLRSGIFWNYFEENGKRAPQIHEESSFPCRFIRANKKMDWIWF